jgi:hypothetical protein
MARDKCPVDRGDPTLDGFIPEPHAQVIAHGWRFLVWREYREPAKGLLFRSTRDDTTLPLAQKGGNTK